MDLEEWEVLSDEGIIDILEDDQKFANNNNNNNISPKFKSKDIYMDYFQNFVEESSNNDDHEIKDQNFDHQEMIPKENQFVDTKIVEVCSHVCAAEPSPAASAAELARFFSKPAVEDSTETDSLDESQKYEKEGGNFEVVEKVKEGEKVVVVGNYEEKVVKMDENLRLKSGGENGVWKWAMNGMGALVSFGVVVASVSLIVFSNQHKENKCSKNQELHFQFYSHDKRFKQVMRRAKRLNEAISVMRGAPLTTAHITVGGYYESL